MTCLVADNLKSHVESVGEDRVTCRPDQACQPAVGTHLVGVDYVPISSIFCEAHISQRNACRDVVLFDWEDPNSRFQSEAEREKRRHTGWYSFKSVMLPFLSVLVGSPSLSTSIYSRVLLGEVIKAGCVPA